MQLVDPVMVGYLTKPVDATKEFAALIRSGLSAAIWISYFLSSARVSSTFVERVPSRPAVLEEGANAAA